MSEIHFQDRRAWILGDCPFGFLWRFETSAPASLAQSRSLSRLTQLSFFALPDGSSNKAGSCGAARSLSFKSEGDTRQDSSVFGKVKSLKCPLTHVLNKALVSLLSYDRDLKIVKFRGFNRLNTLITMPKMNSLKRVRQLSAEGPKLWQRKHASCQQKAWKPYRKDHGTTQQKDYRWFLDLHQKLFKGTLQTRKFLPMEVEQRASRLRYQFETLWHSCHLDCDNYFDRCDWYCIWRSSCSSNKG